jgi:heme-degrading monooxygenase HmoA
MFARVITAEAGAEGFDGVMNLAEAQLPMARRQPGFTGYYVLTDAGIGKVMVISLWETREQMEAVAGSRASGIRDEGLPDTGLTSVNLETYEVPLHAAAPTR